MLDTMTMTKIVGGLCGSFLVFLLGGFAAELIYVGSGTHDEAEHQAYTIPVETKTQTASAATAAPADDGFQEAYAKADVAAGQTIFRKCGACHKIEDGVNATGPSLYGVVGRKVDTEPGYSYSGALAKVVDVWTPENIDHFITNPKGFAPGTKMGFSGLSNVQDRANVIAYLASIPK